MKTWIGGAMTAMVIAAACGGGRGASRGGKEGAYSPQTYHCTATAADTNAVIEACEARGCQFGPPLVCRGTPGGDDDDEARHRAYAAGTEPCTCFCPDDVEACSRVP